jgi:hypothetical protein
MQKGCDFIDEKTKQDIINDYYSDMSYKDMCNKYNIPQWKIDHIIERNNIPRRRFSQKYEIIDDHCEIYIKYHGDYKKCLIDIEDIDKCKSVGIWSITKAGYIVNCKKGIYLHRFIMNCPDNLEVDHIHHNLLDNRKSELRLSTSRQQKYNTKKRIDNTSGHRGIYWDKARQKWHINIKNGSERLHKRLDDFDEACRIVDEKYKEWHGEYKYKDEI